MAPAMRISVRFMDSARRYAYECPYPVRVNDLVITPASWFSGGEDREALVIALDDQTDYAGPLKTVIRVIPWEGNEQ